MKVIQKVACVGLVLLAVTPGFAQSTRLEDVIYGHKSGMALTMDVFKPEKPNGIAVIFMVSGGWVSDQKNIRPEVGKMLADRGYTMFQVCHGSQPKFQVPEIIKDVTRAVRFIRMNATKFGIDPQKLAVAGGSAGGHLALMLGAKGDAGDPDAKDPVERVSSTVQAVCALYPPTDMLNWGEAGKLAVDVPMLKMFYTAFAITDQTPRDHITVMSEALSPVTFFTKAMPPVLFIHGDKDTLVPLQQSTLAIKKLEELKVPTQLFVRQGKGHGFLETGDFDDMLKWFDRYLGKSRS